MSSTLRPYALIAALFTAACAEPLEFADWTIPVPDGTRIIEYAAVPIQERTERIELVEDLVLAPTDPELSFYQPFRLAVDVQHRIYVLDTGKRRIQVFDRDGKYLHRFGGPGQGPGELAGNNAIEVFGDRVVVGDNRLRRMSLWDLAGNLVEDVPYEQLRISLGQPSTDDSFIDFVITDRSESSVESTLVRYSLELEELAKYTSIRTPVNLTIGDDFHPHDPTTRPYSAAERNGPVYVTRGDNYQLLSYEPDGTPRWALRVAQEAPLFTEEMRQEILDIYYNPPGVTVNDRGWPDRMATIDRLMVDGAGRLWVYLIERYNRPEPDEDMLVDLYDRKGDRLFSGRVPSVYLYAPHDDYALALSPDPITEEWRVIRYHLVEPF